MMTTRRLVALAACGLASLTVACAESQPEVVEQARPTPGPLQPLADSGFVVGWGLPAVPATVAPGQRFAAAVIVENQSDQLWLDPENADTTRTGHGAVRLTCRWWKKGDDKTPAVNDQGARGDLTAPLPPGRAAVMALEVTAPPTAGEYQLQLDLVQELVSYFEPKGADRLLVPVTVK
jgi:hypothetical protein